MATAREGAGRTGQGGHRSAAMHEPHKVGQLHPTAAQNDLEEKFLNTGKKRLSMYEAGNEEPKKRGRHATPVG